MPITAEKEHVGEEAVSKPDRHLILYGFWRSGCSWRIRLVLALKGIPYAYKAINLMEGEDCSDEYLKMNPAGLVPTVVLTTDASKLLEQFPQLSSDEVVLSDSVAIAQFLDDVYPDSVRVFPTDPLQKAIVMSLTMLIAAGIQPLATLGILQKVGMKFGEDKKGPWAKEIITERLAEFDVAISKTHGLYCVGNSITFVDLCLVPQVYNALVHGVDMSLFPHINAVRENIGKIAIFQNTEPECMPDAPPTAQK